MRAGGSRDTSGEPLWCCRRTGPRGRPTRRPIRFRPCSRSSLIRLYVYARRAFGDEEKKTIQACVVPMPCGNLRGIGVRSGRASRAVEQFENFYSVETDSCPNFVVPSAEVRATELGDVLQSAVYAGCLSHDKCTRHPLPQIL